jgi:hypothetical protein
MPTVNKDLMDIGSNGYMMVDTIQKCGKWFSQVSNVYINTVWAWPHTHGLITPLGAHRISYTH